MSICVRAEFKSVNIAKCVGIGGGVHACTHMVGCMHMRNVSMCVCVCVCVCVTRM